MKKKLHFKKICYLFLVINLFFLKPANSQNYTYTECLFLCGELQGLLYDSCGIITDACITHVENLRQGCELSCRENPSRAYKVYQKEIIRLQKKGFRDPFSR